MSNILIFSKNIFNITETFIYKQVLALCKSNNVYVAGYKIENNFPKENFTVIRLRRKQFEKRLNFLNKIYPFSTPRRKASFISNQLIKIIRQNNIKLIHAHYGTGGLTVLQAARATNTPIIVSFHGYDASAKLNDKEYVNQLPKLFEYASAIVVCSTHMIQALKLQQWSKKVHFIPYGIDADFFTPILDNRNNNYINLLHSGRIVQKKGVPDLLQVFHKLTKTHKHIYLNIVGAGEELKKCKALVEELGIPADNVRFHGAQTHQRIKEFISDSDIFVLNSRTAADGDMEGLPNTILEAMSMEKPVVSTYHAGIPDAITTGVNGILVNEKDNVALQSAIEQLIVDKGKRIAMGKMARNTVLENFTDEKMSRKLQSLCAELSS